MPDGARNDWDGTFIDLKNEATEMTKLLHQTKFEILVMGSHCIAQEYSVCKRLQYLHVQCG